MTAPAALAGALRLTADSLGGLADRLDKAHLAHVEPARLLILAGPMLEALAEVEKQASYLVGFAPYAGSPMGRQGVEP